MYIIAENNVELQALKELWEHILPEMTPCEIGFDSGETLPYVLTRDKNKYVFYKGNFHKVYKCKVCRNEFVEEDIKNKEITSECCIDTLKYDKGNFNAI